MDFLNFTFLNKFTKEGKYKKIIKNIMKIVEFIGRWIINLNCLTYDHKWGVFRLPC